MKGMAPGVISGTVMKAIVPRRRPRLLAHVVADVIVDLRYRLSHPVLHNPEAIEYAAHFDEPLHLYSSVSSSTKPDGAVVIDWACNLDFWLAGVRRIIVDCDELAHKVRRRLIEEGARRLPEIRVAT